MSTTERNLYNLLSAIKILKELPVMKLAENKTLVSEIQSIVSGKNIASITDGLVRDYRLERDAALNGQQKQAGALSPDSTEFLSLYARYRGAAHNVLEKKSNSAFSNPISMKTAVAFNSNSDKAAFNAKAEGALFKNEISSLPEAKKFKEAFIEICNSEDHKDFAAAFNSIYSDHALQIRTPNDPTAISSFIDYSPYIWNYRYYLSIPTLAQTIDLPIQIATRQPPRLDFNDPKLKEIIEKKLKRGKIAERIHRMLLYSSLSPRGALIVPIQDEDGTIRFNVFNDTQFTYATSYQYSRIDFRENLTGVSSLYVLGHLLQNEVTAHFLCPGFEPLYAIGKNRIYQLKDAAEAINIYLYTIKVLCIRAQIITQQSNGEFQNDTLLAEMIRMTKDVNSKLSMNEAVQIPDGTKMEILNNNLSEGFAKVPTTLKEYQAMLSGMMPDYLYGSDTAYAANNFNIHATHQNIRSQFQEQQIEPLYRFIINKYLELDKDLKAYKGHIDEFEVEFESMYEPTASEKAEIDAKRISNIVTMAGYPELQQIFKDESLLNEEVEMPALPEPVEEEEFESGQGEVTNSTLVQEIDPKTIQPLHEVRYEPKMMRLVKRMDESGWQGKPLLVVERAMNTYRAITGTHRIQAAEIQGIMVPVVVLPSVEIVNSMTTGKDKRRRQIINSKEFEEAIGRPDLVALARDIINAEVEKNEKGW